MALRTLTVKERIQLHLFDHNRYAEAYEVPVDVTQGGIARAVAIRVHHVPQYIRPLMSDGLVDERTSHIQRKPRKRKVYFLTGKGRTSVASLRDSLLKEEIPFRAADGKVVDVPLLKVYQEDRRGSKLLELFGELQTRGYVPEVVEVAPGEVVDFTQDAPKVERFYGREAELKEVLAALDRAPLVVVTGMAGMGKTTLASRVCDVVRGKKSLFWRQVRPWDTALDLSLRLAAFLASLGRTALHGNLMGPEPKELSRIEELLAADLGGVSAVFVLDDVHQASEDAQAFLAILHRVLKPQKGSAALFLSRTVPSIHSRRDVEVERSVVELPLKGLDATSGRSLLADAGIADPLAANLVEACHGSPLFLNLVARKGPSHAPEEVRHTMETYISEELEPTLEDAERGCLELASFYQLPVPSRGLLLEEGVRRKTLNALLGKGLLDRFDSDSLGIHDFVRGYFQQGISEARREVLVEKVAPWLAKEADRAAQGGRPQEAIALLGNAVSIEVTRDRRRLNLERLGDFRRVTGDVQAAVETYKAASADSVEAKDKARLGQKVAGMLIVQGHLEEAEREIEAGLNLLRPQPSIEAAWFLYRKASVAQSREDFTAALEELERVTSWLPGLPADPLLRGSLANLRGLVFMSDPKREDPALAQADFRAALEACEAANDLRGIALAYNNLGWAAIEMGRAEEALRYLDRSAAMAETAGDVPGRQIMLQTKAWCLSEFLGDSEASEALYQESYKLAKLTNNPERLMWLYYHFANLYRRQGRYEEARESLEYFFKVSLGLLGPENRVQGLSLMVRTCIACSDAGAAERYLREAESLAHEEPSDFGNHLVEWARATLLASQGDKHHALLGFQRSLGLATMGHHGEFLFEYGRFLASIGDRRRAKEVLRQACTVLAEDALKPLEREAARALRSVEHSAKS